MYRGDRKGRLPGSASRLRLAVCPERVETLFLLFLDLVADWAVWLPPGLVQSSSPAAPTSWEMGLEWCVPLPLQCCRAVWLTGRPQGVEGVRELPVAGGLWWRGEGLCQYV